MLDVFLRKTWLGLAVGASSTAVFRLITFLVFWPLCGHAAEGPVITDRVERRFVEKSGRVELAFGLARLDRGDFYQNLGLQGSLAYWFDEALALEVETFLYDAADTDAVTAVRRDLGFVPDIQRQEAAAGIGGRWSFAYGKALLGRSHIIHFDPQLFSHAGLHFTDLTNGPYLDLGLSIAVRPWRWFHARLDLAAIAQGVERIDGWTLVFAFQPSFVVGLLL